MLEYKGINIFYTDKGKGKVIVLLHGFLENSTIWKNFIPSLVKTNRIISVDLLGHGKTGCLGYVHTMELMAEAVLAVLKHLKIKQSIFIAHSMGGYVALAFAKKYPEAILGLCLANSTSQKDSPERKRNRDRAIIAVKQNYKSFVRIAITNLFRPKNRVLFSEQIRDIKNEALKTPLQGIVAALEGMKIRSDSLDTLKNASFKKTMFISKNDPVLNYNELLEEAKKTKAEVAEFPDGHMSFIENEALFLRSIVHFIEYI